MGSVVAIEGPDDDARHTLICSTRNGTGTIVGDRRGIEDAVGVEVKEGTTRDGACRGQAILQTDHVELGKFVGRRLAARLAGG